MRRAILLGLCLAGLATSAEKPNLLLILVDDLGPEWISAYGAEGIETPNVDALARRGMLFENAYSMPQCTPTRVTLLTGQYPYRHGWTNHWDVPRWGAGAHFDPGMNLSFARLARDAGYATAIAGKWQINDFRVQPNALRDHGFDEWAVWTGYETGVPESAERYEDAYIYTSEEPSRTYEGRFGPDVYNEFLLDFIERNQGEPWLAYYPLALTHTPLIATPHEPFAESDLERHRAMVRYTDYLVGRLMKKLDELRLTERTYVVFTTDNGTTRRITGRLNGRDVRGGKAQLTENGIRAPFLVAGPGVAPGSRTRALTDFSDLFPTLVELAGGETPAGYELDGRSLVPALHGEDLDGPREWVVSMGFGPARLDEKGVRPVQDFTDRIVRGRRYKLHVLDGKPAKLYDLISDPAEERNLIASERPQHQRALAGLTAVVEAMPEKDGRPRYEPNPPQPWDISRKENEKMWRR